MASKILFAILFVFILMGFVSAVQVDDSFLNKTLIVQLPEIHNYFFHDRDFIPEQGIYRLDIRYNQEDGYYQKSEFYVVIYNSSLDKSIMDNQINQSPFFPILKDVNGNKILEGSSIAPSGLIQRMVSWISNNVSITGWNGDDAGSVVDNSLFDALTIAYLQKYPSTYSTIIPPDCTDECSSVGQKRCEGDYSQTCGNYDNDECLEWNFGMICPYGCSNGICDYILEEQENGTIFYIAPNITSGPIEMPKENELTTQPAPIICQGCELDNKCYPYGFRKENKFCSDSNNQFIEQKEADSICENNFECSTNLCIDDQCISKGIWQKFLEWFKRLFGAD